MQFLGSMPARSPTGSSSFGSLGSHASGSLDSLINQGSQGKGRGRPVNSSQAGSGRGVAQAPQQHKQAPPMAWGRAASGGVSSGGIPATNQPRQPRGSSGSMGSHPGLAAASQAAQGVGDHAVPSAAGGSAPQHTERAARPSPGSAEAGPQSVPGLANSTAAPSAESAERSVSDATPSANVQTPANSSDTGSAAPPASNDIGGAQLREAQGSGGMPLVVLTTA